MNDRKSGVLMHISSLPGGTGIGTLGKSAYDFVDFLKASGQKYWQVLPVCPTSYGDSPYQSFSAFAGNPYFIDLDMLCKDGLLSKSDYENITWGDDDTDVDYYALYKMRHKLFLTLQKRFVDNTPSDFREFCEQNAFWLDDYALFMAVKDAHGGISFLKWEDDIRMRKPGVCEMWRVKCSERVQYYKMLQYLFYKQWFSLKKYANASGVEIIGDLPIYVSADSADVWSNPKQFVLDDDLRPVEVAGCPPDEFSKDGQLWGNPVYDWKYMKRTKYRWWIERLRFSLKIYDVIRIDHFRGFDSYYCVKYGDKTAKDGIWRKGPKMDLWKTVGRKLGDLPIIAEDLGFMTDSVKKLLKASGFYGMKVMQFGFEPYENSDYLPHNYTKNCVVYTGTHDNDTINGWAENSDDEQVDFAMRYLQAENKCQIREKMMISALASTANICILTMQDLLGLSGEARMNIPSTVGQNWRWRMKSGSITESLTRWLYDNTALYGRTKKDTQCDFAECEKDSKENDYE